MNPDSKTKRKLRDMGATGLMEAFQAQDDVLSAALSVEERVAMAVDTVYGTFSHSKADERVGRAKAALPE